MKHCHRYVKVLHQGPKHVAHRGHVAHEGVCAVRDAGTFK